MRFSEIDKGARPREYNNAIIWLTDSMIVNVGHGISEPRIALGLSEKQDDLRCYMGDTGLLISLAFNEKELVSEEIYQKILTDKLDFNGGMVAENIISQMLVAGGHRLHFYYNPTRENAEDRMEIDFIIAKSKITSRHNLSPIEAKSGKNYTLNSLNKFMVKYKENLDQAYVVHTGNLKVENGIVYLPMYMTGLL